jgi:hypothetical protein
MRVLIAVILTIIVLAIIGANLNSTAVQTNCTTDPYNVQCTTQYVPATTGP